MSRPALEVADIFRDHGAAWRRANAGHVSLDQLKVMTAIERCRTAALGGHVARCENCAHTVIAYNSCRNRHCPKCQGAAAKQWLAEREAELLPVPYFHVVFTLPAPVADIAYQNKAVIYDLLFKAAADTTLTIAADPKHLGARIGITAVLHTWGSAHDTPSASAHDRARRRPCRSTDSAGCRAGQVSSCRCACSRACSAGCFSRCSPPRTRPAASTSSATTLHAPTPKHSPPSSRRCARSNGWSMPRGRSADPRPCSLISPRYTHRVAIANSRLVAAGQHGVTFKWKDYRIDGPARYKIMTLPTREFIRRFLMHVLPKGLHRIRHYGLFASADRAANIERARQLLAAPSRSKDPETPNATATDEQHILPRPCPCCGGRMIIIETFERRCEPKYRPTPTPVTIRIDSS